MSYVTVSHNGEFRVGGERGTALISGVNFRSIPVIYSNIKGIAIFEGDIALGSVHEIERAMGDLRSRPPDDLTRAVVITGNRFRWPRGEIAFEIDQNLPNQQRVRDAILHWEDSTAILFIERTAANSDEFPNWVRFMSDDGCWAHIGMRGGQQTISLDTGCSVGNAIHEIGHAVGLWHEQSREFRDLFVTINWANIDPDELHNFDQHISDGDNIGAYDYGSIMHYPRDAFSSNGDTITPVDPSAQIGQREGLSPGDIAAVDAMYLGGQAWDFSPSVDLTGDGRADVIGFGDRRVWVSLNNGDGSFQAAKPVIDNNFCLNAGEWRVHRHPRFLADLTGDGRADIVGFGNAGVWVALNNGDGSFQTPKRVIDNSFGFRAGNWRVHRHPRFLADLTGDGRADIVGFGNAGVWVALNNGDGSFQTPKRVINNSFGFNDNAGGWRVSSHPRFLADLTGDGRADIVGFGNDSVWVALNNGDGSFQTPKRVINNNFGFNHIAGTGGRWRVYLHPRFLADLTGDGRADIVGFGNDGVWVALNNGDGSFQAPKKVINEFGLNNGYPSRWRVDRNPRFLADLTGDGRADIVGFGNYAVTVAVNNGDGSFQTPNNVINNNFGFNDDAGQWRVDMHPRFLADLTGDGRADIVGFGNDSVWVALNNGDGSFQAPKRVINNNFGVNNDAGGWRVEFHPRSIVGSG